MKSRVALLMGCVLLIRTAHAALPPIDVLADSIRPEVAIHLQQTLPGVLNFERDSGATLAALQSLKGTSHIVLLSCSGIHTPAEEYEGNLRAMVGLAEKKGLLILWSNSPPSANPAENVEVEVRNNIAATVMEEHHIITIDFHGFCQSLVPKDAPPTVQDEKLWKREAEFFAESLGQWWAVCSRTNPDTVRTPLWPAQPPDYKATGPECINNRGRVQGVSIPEITRFSPEMKSSGTALIVFPGGGYAFMGYLRNAQELSRQLAPKGIAVFGLKYRTGRGWEPPLLDAQRAVRWVRLHAAESGIDPHRIGVAGISAGANLALRLSGSFTEGDPTSTDPIERQSSRPDFVAVFSSWNNGSWDSPFVFHADTPPVFLRHARDDKGFPLAEKVVSQLQSAGVKLNFLYLEKGGHGAFDMAPESLGKNWPDEFLPWLTQLGLYTPPVGAVPGTISNK